MAKNNTPVGWGEQVHREPQHCNVGVHKKAVHHQPAKTKIGTNISGCLPKVISWNINTRKVFKQIVIPE